jgi:hypothetical protein
MLKKVIITTSIIIVLFLLGFGLYFYFTQYQYKSYEDPKKAIETVITECKEIGLPRKIDRIDYFTKLYNRVDKSIKFDETKDTFVGSSKIKYGVQVLNLNRQKIENQTAESPACWFVWVTDLKEHGSVSYEDMNGNLKIIKVKKYHVEVSRKYW